MSIRYRSRILCLLPAWPTLEILESRLAARETWRLPGHRNRCMAAWYPATSGLSQHIIRINFEHRPCHKRPSTIQKAASAAAHDKRNPHSQVTTKRVFGSRWSSLDVIWLSQSQSDSLWHKFPARRAVGGVQKQILGKRFESWNSCECFNTATRIPSEI